eukprot:IDg16166t1
MPVRVPQDRYRAATMTPHRAAFTKKAKLLLVDDVTLFGHIDTVQEAADILATHKADMVDHCCALRNELDVRALDDELILDLGRAVARNIALHFDAAHALLAEKVADLDRLVVISTRHVDGKMSIHETQLVPEAACHARDQILNNGAHRVDLGCILARPVPHFDLQLIILPLNIDHGVPYIARQRPARALHSHNARLDTYGDYALISREMPPHRASIAAACQRLHIMHYRTALTQNPQRLQAAKACARARQLIRKPQ